MENNKSKVDFYEMCPTKPYSNDDMGVKHMFKETVDGIPMTFCNKEICMDKNTMHPLIQTEASKVTCDDCLIELEKLS